MIAHIVASLGWGWDEVRETMDLPRLQALNTYWAEHPPLHLSLAAALGLGAHPKPEPGKLEDLMNAFPAG